MSDVERLRRAARATVRRKARGAEEEAEAERLARNAEYAASLGTDDDADAASATPGAPLDLSGDRVDAPTLQLYGAEGAVDAEDQLLEVSDLVLETAVAPDPYDEAPEARAVALAPLLHGGTRAFGLSRLPASFHALSGSGKLEWLLSLPEPRATLQALPAEEFTLLLDEIGLADAGDLFELASPRQLQAAVDLLAWQGDTLDRRTFAHLLAVALSAGSEVVDRFLAAQEDGVLTAFAFGSAMVFEGFEDAEQGAPEDWELFAAPDGQLQIAVDPQDAALGPIRTVVESLFRISIERGRRVLRALRWELPLALQEDLYDHRTRRLGDLGMMPRDEALSVFAYVAPETARAALEARLAGEGARAGDGLQAYVPPPALAQRTDLALRAGAEPAFLAAAAARLPDAEALRVQTALCFCVYRLQCALAEHPADTEALPRHARQVLTMVDLGLRFAARDDVERAAQILALEPVESLFSLGHGQVVQLHHRAVALRRRLGNAGRAALFDGVEGAIVRALLRPLPMWPSSADELVEAATGSRDAARIAIAAMAAGADEDFHSLSDGDVHWRGSVAAAGDEADAELDGESDEGQEQAARQSADDERAARDRSQRVALRPYESLQDLARARLALQRFEAVTGLLEGAAEGPLPAALDTLERELGERRWEWDLSALLATTLCWALLEGSPALRALDATSLRRLLAQAMVGAAGQRRLRAELRTAIASAALSAPGLDDPGAAGLERAIAAAFDRIDAELGGLDPRSEIDVRFIGRSLVVVGRAVDPNWN